MKSNIKASSYPPTKYAIEPSKNLDRMEFESSLKRSLCNRINNSFINTYKPVLDDAPYRIFDSMRAYRKWCQKKLPRWLGYGR